MTYFFQKTYHWTKLLLSCYLDGSLYLYIVANHLQIQSCSLGSFPIHSYCPAYLYWEAPFWDQSAHSTARIGHFVLLLEKRAVCYKRFLSLSALLIYKSTVRITLRRFQLIQVQIEVWFWFVWIWSVDTTTPPTIPVHFRYSMKHHV